MSPSPDDAQNSSDIMPTQESRKAATDKPMETLPAIPFDQWLIRALEVANEMATNEAVRKEVAKRLT